MDLLLLCCVAAAAYGQSSVETVHVAHYPFPTQIFNQNSAPFFHPTFAFAVRFLYRWRQTAFLCVHRAQLPLPTSPLSVIPCAAKQKEPKGARCEGCCSFSVSGCGGCCWLRVESIMLIYFYFYCNLWWTNVRVWVYVCVSTRVHWQINHKTRIFAPRNFIRIFNAAGDWAPSNSLRMKP